MHDSHKMVSCLAHIASMAKPNVPFINFQHRLKIFVNQVPFQCAFQTHPRWLSYVKDKNGIFAEHLGCVLTVTSCTNWTQLVNAAKYEDKDDGRNKHNMITTIFQIVKLTVLCCRNMMTVNEHTACRRVSAHAFGCSCLVAHIVEERKKMKDTKQNKSKVEYFLCLKNLFVQ